MWIEEGKLKRLAEHPIARYFDEEQRVQITSERVDDLPLLLAQLKEVRVPELLNESFPTPRKLAGLESRTSGDGLVALYPGDDHGRA